MIEINGDKGDLKNALESLAYEVLKYRYPNWYDIPEDEIISLLNEYTGVYAIEV